ncbi:MAG: ABC transporter substrate-binding protein, partial [Euryarchaeota archaeon]|nr:ABC transporter substrate-binding protein [Euryarchaeota archaeon]
MAKGSSLTTTNAEHILRIGVVSTGFNFNYFDPGTYSQSKDDIMAWVFEGLMDVDYDGSAYPRLAEKVSFDSSTMTATIYLRHNVTFQDGTPMTAKDVIFSYCALRQGTTVSGTAFAVPFDDNNDGTISLQEIENHVKYVNEYEVQISTRQPYARFFMSTLTIPIIPEHIWKDHLTTDYSGESTSVNAEGYTAGVVDLTWHSNPEAMIGTGPLMYAGSGATSSLVEKPYNGYWGKNIKTPDGYPLWNPGISEIIYREYSNAQEATYALKAGEIDCLPFNIGASGANLLKDDSSVNLYKSTENGYYYLAFNEKTQPANYIAFRHAVSHVIDKNTIVQKYLGGYGQAGDSPEPPFFTAWYNASVQHYPYDLNTAKDILDGYKVVADNGFVEQD